MKTLPWAASVAVAVLCAGVTGGLMALELLEPPTFAPRTVAFPIPNGAEVYPDTVVDPGTFSIAEPLDRFLERTEREGGRPIVTYSEDPADRDTPPEDWSPVAFHYWLPRPDGVVYHAVFLPTEGQRLPTLGNEGFLTDRVTVRGSTATLSLIGSVSYGTAAAGIVLLILAAVACLIGFYGLGKTACLIWKHWRARLAPPRAA